MSDYKLVELIMGLNLMKQSQDLTEDQKISIRTLEILADAIEKIVDLRRPKFKPAAIVGESGGEIVLPNIRKDRINFATDERATFETHGMLFGKDRKGKITHWMPLPPLPE